MSWLKWSCVAASSVLLSAGSALAQEFEVENFRPVSPGDGELLSVESTSQVADGGYALGLMFSVVDDPLVVVDETDEERVAAVVGNRLATNLAAAYGFGPIELSAMLPLVLYQNSAPNPRVGVMSSEGSAVGDLRLGARARLAGDGPGFGVSGSLVATAPTATGVEFAGQGTPQVVPRLTTEWRASRALVAANVGARLRGSERVGDLEVGSAFIYGLGATVHPKPFGPVSIIGELAGEVAGMDRRSAPLEARAGLRATLGDSIAVSVAYGRGLVHGYGAPDQRALLMMSYGPKQPEPPTQVRTRTGIAVNEPPPDPDPDGDGILDDADRCPRTAEDFDGYEDSDGCPEEDNDSDGILDAGDECANHAEDVDEFEDEDGCPDPDNDMDGITDVDDKCAVKAETINGVEDDDGCPDKDKALVEVGERKIEIKEMIYFALDRAEILPRSEPLLEQLAKTITRSGWIKKIRIEGHTDASGPKKYNRELSQRRAEAVMQALISRGVAEPSLEAVGHGESQPIDTNDTLRGRAHNRRVEFHIVDQDETKRPANVGKDKEGLFDQAGNPAADEDTGADSTGADEANKTGADEANKTGAGKADADTGEQADNQGGNER